MSSVTMQDWKKRININMFFTLTITTIYLLTNFDKTHGQPISLEDLKMIANLDENYDQEAAKRGSPGGMWFGPRLGRRSSDFSSDHSAWYEASDYNPTYGLSGFTFRPVPRLGRDASEQEKTGPSKSVDFIPRLGRELTRELIKSLFEKEYGRDRSISKDKIPALIKEYKSPPFAPRLGRELYFTDIYGPGQGFDLVKDANLRITRSANHDKSTPKEYETEKPGKS